MSRRDAIKLSGEEARSFLEGERTVVATTNGVRGWPHSMPLWYVVRGAEGPPAGDGDAAPSGGSPAPEDAGGVELWAWTFAKSQKVRNLERDDRVTLLVEAGESYDQLRGVMIEAQAILHRDYDVCLRLGKEIFARYSGGHDALTDDAVSAVEAQAAKRVAMQFRPLRVATWDHRKLGGAY